MGIEAYAPAACGLAYMFVFGALLLVMSVFFPGLVGPSEKG